MVQKPSQLDSRKDCRDQLRSHRKRIVIPVSALFNPFSCCRKKPSLLKTQGRWLNLNHFSHQPEGQPVRHLSFTRKTIKVTSFYCAK